MSIYDKGHRPSIADPNGTTAASVGPGSYDTLSGQRQRQDASVPFMSTSVRDTHINLHDTNVAAPGPGHYDVAVAVPVRGYYSSKCKRFVDALKLTPGPGHYDSAPKTVVSIKRETHSSPLPGRKVVLVRQPSAPSIPSSRDAFGFAETIGGFLMKQPPPRYDNTLGPAYYDVEKDISHVTSAYKGVHWGKRTTKRNLGTADDEKIARQLGNHRALYSMLSEEAEVNKTNRNSRSALPRHHVKVGKNLTKPGHEASGPVTADGGLVKSFQTVELISRAKMAVEHPPFGSSSGTGRVGRSTKMFPSQSDLVDATLASMTHKTTGADPPEVPFGGRAPRFARVADGIPGPGSYNVSDIATDSLKKAYAESMRKGVFGSTGSRMEPPSQDAVCLPGPTHYCVNTDPGRHVSMGSASFMSTTHRFGNDAGPNEALSEAVDEMQQPFTSTAGKVEHSQLPATTMHRESSVFRSASDRFEPPRDFARRPVDPRNPGPGKYDPLWSAFTHQPGAMVTHSQRFSSEAATSTPGPNHYSYPLLLKDSVLKGSFNKNLAVQSSE